MGCKNCCNACLQCLFGYETNVMLVINNKGVGALFRLIQFLIIAYVAVYVCWIQRAYQDTDSVISSVSTKVKGNILTNSPIEGVHVWDVPEYVIPPQGENTFFVLTNVILTPGQRQSKCPETPSEVTKCESDSDCKEGYSDVHGNGVQTGHCAQYSDKIKTCEVQAWCPLENDANIPKPAVLSAAEDFTVLIKNNIQYPKFKFKKRNILPHINSTYLKSCMFNRKTDPDCPIFRLGDMVTEAGEDFSVMALKGGIIGIFIDWNCDLDFSERFCIPKYSFSRLDNKNPENNVAPGYNFRFAKYYKNNESIDTRTLIKAFGIRFDVIVFGMAGKFNIVPTIVNLGATLAFLSLTAAICDWVMLTCMKDRDNYAKHKFIHLNQNGDSMPLSSMETSSYGTP
ncbi:P2X purinoceptor 4b isoform X8 [Carassius gibelio]|uniref:P2X purinoceptor 4b isoform X4 n=1 Tax=Carassius gibelio TaxID=101364 RepID=UPI00227840E6|nr:P2X purinoceptor 4b isoform X4 [Carassius gibelio]XP_052418516.1 P2X purinoceptor 4b isoform X8 [Carassius gibelio]